MKKEHKGKQTEQLTLEKAKVIQAPKVEHLKKSILCKIQEAGIMIKTHCLKKKKDNEEKKFLKKNVYNY